MQQDEHGLDETGIAQTRVSKTQAREILQASLPIPGDVQQDLNRHLLAIGSEARRKSLQVCQRHHRLVMHRDSLEQDHTSNFVDSMRFEVLSLSSKLNL